jgi:hypothetical protein
MTDFSADLQKVLDLQSDIAALNPLFEQHYPVAIAVGEQFLIHEVDPQSGQYVLTQEVLVPMPIPEGVRAAFQIDALDGRCAAVVTTDAFENQNEQVLVLHEFVHCHQAATCEDSLKGRLEIAKQAKAEGHQTWELDSPFPYEGEAFARLYPAWMEALKADDTAAARSVRAELCAALAPLEVEYMVWQEWKEGTARWVENQIQRRLGLPVNTYGDTPPFNRITFYAGGATYFDWLAEREPGVMTDLPELFDRLLTASEGAS